MKFIAATLASYLCALGLLLAGVENANAVILSDSGLDQVTKHYRIDSLRSTISYNSGEVSFGLGGKITPPTLTYSFSGAFDVEFQHWWWSYYQDGDSQGTQGTYTDSSDWIRFLNAVVFASGLPSGFEFPKFSSQLSGPTDFSGSNAACAYPKGPGEYCSGFNAGGISGVSGQILDGKIIFDGSQPNANYSSGGGYTYHIEASVVPVPSAFWLFASVLGLWGARMKSYTKTV